MAAYKTNVISIKIVTFKRSVSASFIVFLFYIAGKGILNDFYQLPCPIQLSETFQLLF